MTNRLVCVAICMYVVALVNCISFDKGEKMNKVSDAINRTRRLSLQRFSLEVTLSSVLLSQPHREQRIMSLVRGAQ